MTPTETAAFLRRYNEWRRDDEDILQFDVCKIGEAIDAAVEMIERGEQETAAQRAKVERMEKRLRLILEEPENTMSNSKALREMVRQARLALEESK